MYFDDLLYIRAHMSTGPNHPMLFSPAASASNSPASTPDNRSLASHKKKRSFFSGQRPVVKAANCGAGMKLPMNIA